MASGLIVAKSCTVACISAAKPNPGGRQNPPLAPTVTGRVFIGLDRNAHAKTHSAGASRSLDVDQMLNGCRRRSRLLTLPYPSLTHCSRHRRCLEEMVSSASMLPANTASAVNRQFRRNPKPVFHYQFFLNPQSKFFLNVKNGGGNAMPTCILNWRLAVIGSSGDVSRLRSRAHMLNFCNTGRETPDAGIDDRIRLAETMG